MVNTGLVLTEHESLAADKLLGSLVTDSVVGMFLVPLLVASFGGTLTGVELEDALMSIELVIGVELEDKWFEDESI